MLAFPRRALGSARMAESSPTLTYDFDRKPFDFATLLDGNPGTTVRIPWPPRVNRSM